MGLTHRELGSNATAGVTEALIERLVEVRAYRYRLALKIGDDDMSNSYFWRLASIGVIAGIFYVGHGLHCVTNSEQPGFAAAAIASEPMPEDQQIQWITVDQSKYYPDIMRTKVQGGWLVMIRDEGKKQFAVVFVPDADHSWNPLRSSTD